VNPLCQLGLKKIRKEKVSQWRKPLLSLSHTESSIQLMTLIQIVNKDDFVGFYGKKAEHFQEDFNLKQNDRKPALIISMSLLWYLCSYYCIYTLWALISNIFDTTDRRPSFDFSSRPSWLAVVSELDSVWYKKGWGAMHCRLNLSIRQI